MGFPSDYPQRLSISFGGHTMSLFLSLFYINSRPLSLSFFLQSQCLLRARLFFLVYKRHDRDKVHKKFLKVKTTKESRATADAVTEQRAYRRLGRLL